MSSNVPTAYHGLLWIQGCKQYQGKWLSDETIVREINRAYPNITDGGITRRALNFCASPRGTGKFRGGIIERFDEYNKTGLFRYQAHHIYCIHEMKTRGKIWFYYIGKEGQLAPRQPKNADFPIIASDNNFSSNIDTRSDLKRKVDDINNMLGKEVGLAVKKRVEVNYYFIIFYYNKRNNVCIDFY